MVMVVAAVVVAVMVAVVMAFSSLARIFGKCSTTHFPPVLFCFVFLKWRLARAH